mmetsp:Transcript_20563/g.24930  ORF Transcript_20563/g.24930 Transcript_20563/m.24930 type:complete len:89 (+) Transcript_20563:404-670(+)
MTNANSPSHPKRFLSQVFLKRLIQRKSSANSNPKTMPPLAKRNVHISNSKHVTLVGETGKDATAYTENFELNEALKGLEMKVPYWWPQ